MALSRGGLGGKFNGGGIRLGELSRGRNVAVKILGEEGGVVFGFDLTFDGPAKASDVLDADEGFFVCWTGEWSIPSPPRR